jgi:hypothetical protein
LLGVGVDAERRRSGFCTREHGRRSRRGDAHRAQDATTLVCRRAGRLGTNWVRRHDPYVR